MDFDAFDPRGPATSGGGGAGSSTITTMLTSSSSSASSASSGSGEGGGGGFAGGGGGGDGGTGGGTGGAGGQPPPLGPFTDIQPVTVLNSAADDDDPSFTDDLLEVYFNSSRAPGTDGDLYVSKRASSSAPWGAPAALTEFNTGSVETNAEISPDGLTFWFSRRVAGDLDIFRAVRTSRQAPWGTAALMAELDTTMGNETFGGQTSDGLYALITSDGGGATPVLWDAHRTSVNGPWTMLAQLPGFSTAGYTQAETWLAADGLEFWFRFNDNGTTTMSDDIYRSVRANRSDAWGPPSPVPELNTSVGEGDPHLSPDRRYIMFSRAVTPTARSIFEARR